jgi:Na+-transporting NADH:ubiquinone oxidoreductase subunit NqrD
MIMAPSAFFLVAMALWGFKTLQDKMKTGAAPASAQGASK